MHRQAVRLATTPIWVAGLFAASLTMAGRDHDEIRRLRGAGQILSLETIIASHRREYPGGELLEAELESERGRYVYELRILGDDGVVREFEYDARTGELWHLEPEVRK
ncbi:MAG: PepSY domain-containing protein [Candidatus Competibacter sp.]|nr:PepSY domain-containing protein [Candidatus Competibacter sp.]MDS4070436.1 PepSY domain-containing protein [Candidatus Competibacter sp.]